MTKETEPAPAPDAKQDEPTPSSRRVPSPRREPMKKSERKKSKPIEDSHLLGVMHMARGKKNEGPWLRATVFPREGGAPYPEDVDVDEGGTFTLEGSNLTYYIARGSVWEEDGVYRCIVNEGNAMTIHGHSLTGDDSMTPEAIHGIAWNNLWWQYDDETRPRSPWPMRGAIGIGIFAFLLLGTLVWFIISTGQDLESIRQAIEDITFNQSGRSTTPPAEGGHQALAPGSS